VLEAYDANLDGKLTESEREAACKALASGRIRFDVKKKSSKPDPRLAEHERSMKAKQHKQSHSGGDKRRPHERPDPHAHKRHSEERKRHEGGGNDDEAQKRKDKTMMQYGYWIEKHDKNGDGELNDQEKAAAKADYHKSFTAATPAVRAANQAKLNEWRRRYAAKMAARKAGKSPTPKSKPPTPQAPEPKPVLSEEEQAKQDERNKRKAEFLEKYDTNRDGKISSEEKSAFVRDIKAKKAEREKEKAKLRKDSGKRKPPKPPKSHKKRPRKGR